MKTFSASLAVLGTLLALSGGEPAIDGSSVGTRLGPQPASDSAVRAAVLLHGEIDASAQGLDPEDENAVIEELSLIHI